MIAIQNEGPPPGLLPPARDILHGPRPAPISLRSLAMFIDLGPVALICAPMLGLLLRLDSASPPHSAAPALVLGPLMWLACGLYFVLMEASPLQATLGMMALGLRVAGSEGERISRARSAWRLFVMLIGLCVFPVSLVLALRDARRRALHDLLSGCEVIVVQNGQRVPWDADGPYTQTPGGPAHPEGVTARGGVREEPSEGMTR